MIFKQYILNHKTEKTFLYNKYLKNTIIILPEYVCSSKKIYSIIKHYLNSYLLNKIFTETFSEYFVYKIKACHEKKIEEDVIDR